MIPRLLRLLTQPIVEDRVAIDGKVRARYLPRPYRAGAEEAQQGQQRHPRRWKASPAASASHSGDNGATVRLGRIGRARAIALPSNERIFAQRPRDRP